MSCLLVVPLLTSDPLLGPTRPLVTTEAVARLMQFVLCGAVYHTLQFSHMAFPWAGASSHFMEEEVKAPELVNGGARAEPKDSAEDPWGLSTQGSEAACRWLEDSLALAGGPLTWPPHQVWGGR